MRRPGDAERPDGRDTGREERLTPLAVARRIVLESVRIMPVQRVPSDDALGAVLAEPVVALHNVPPFVNSSMDGYALRAADTVGAPVTLRVVEEILAGRTPRSVVAPGESAKIMTGAPLPAGADAVVQVEHSHPEGPHAVVIERECEVGTNVRRPGDDVVEGATVFDRGTVVQPAHLGVLASLGVTDVTVHRLPRVGVLSTGDEVVTGPAEAGGAKIRDSNRPSLLGALRRSGFPAHDLGVVPDDEERIGAALSAAAESCDAILTTGGVSMGDVDYVRVVLEKLTAGTMRWMKVAIKPAKPFAFGVLAETDVPVFGLAGNPVSAVVGFELFARPALRVMAGHTSPDRPVLRATVGEPLLRTRDGKVHLLRVVVRSEVDGTLSVRPSGGQGSHMLRTAAYANALALVPDGDGIEKGAPVDVLVLDADDLGGRSEVLGVPEQRR